MPIPQQILDQVNRLAASGRPASHAALGVAQMDAALGGGLKLGALHEVYAATAGDEAAATGYALCLAARAAAGRPIVWVRQDMTDAETGRVHAPGLADIGIAPDSIVLVRGRDAHEVLKAGEDAARCAGLGAVLIAPWSNPRQLDLTASRRLTLAAAESGVTAMMLRLAATPAPSTAETRWRVASASSRLLDANAPGFPVFDVTLLRRRGGAAGQTWLVEWTRDRLVSLADGIWRTAPLSRPVAALSAGRTAYEAIRRTG